MLYLPKYIMTQPNPKTRPRTISSVQPNPVSDPTSREALLRLRLVYGTVQKHYRAVERCCGIGGAQLWALAEIGDKPGISIRQLTAALMVHQSTASNLVDRIERLGLVCKSKDDIDRRVVKLFPTAKGCQLLGRAPQPAVGVLPDALRRLPQDTAKLLVASLDALIAELKLSAPSAASTPLADL